MEDIFVGRVECTEELKAAWNRGQYKIFGIYGPKSVGKSRYVRNFLRILRTSDKSDKVKTTTFDFHRIRTYEAYIATVAGHLNIMEHEVCSHTNCNCIQNVIKFLKGSEDVYIFHHDHQEEAKSKPDSDGTLPDSPKQTLWDQIYAEVIKPLLTECSNFYLIISSTDEFRFAHLRRVFWMQRVPALTEKESMELLNDVCPSPTDDTNSRKHVVRLCEGIPPALINAGLLMKDNVISVDEVIQLMVKQIIEVLSDEFLPHPERINTQLQNRWKHLSEEQSDNLVKTLVIIKYTSQSTIAANAKLLKYKNLAEYKFHHLLPLLRRNLLSYNKEKETVSPCPLIQHILEAVNYIKADEIREELQEQIKAILEPRPQNGASSCLSDCETSSLCSNSVDLPNNPCACPQNYFAVGDRAKQCAFQNNIYQEPSIENLRSRGQLNGSFKTPVENDNFEKPPIKSFGGIQLQEMGLDDSDSNSESRKNSLVTNLNRRSLEKDKIYECKDILNTRFSLNPEHKCLDIMQSQLNHSKKNNHETCLTFPQENEENYQSADDNTSLSSEHSEELISRGPNVSQSGKSQKNSSIDNSNLGPAVTLSCEYETRMTEKPDDSSALPFSEKPTQNLQKQHTDQCPDVTLSGVGSIPLDRSGIQLSSSYSSENTQDCLRSGAEKGHEVTISGIAASCVEKPVNNSPNVRKDNKDQGPYVTISGVYQTINSENKILIKDLRELTVSKSEEREANIQGQTVPRIVPKSPVQVSEEADGVNCTIVKDGFPYPLGHLYTTAVINETGIPSKNVPSNFSGVSNLREGSTNINNMGFITNEASPSLETVPQPCVPSSLNNQKSNSQNPSSTIETSKFCQSTKEATGIPCKMETEKLSGLRHRPQNHSRTLHENIKPKDSQGSQSTISFSESNVDVHNGNAPQTLMTSGNTTHRVHENLSYGESMANRGAIGSTGNENPYCRVNRDHASYSSIVTSLGSSLFSNVTKVVDIYNSLE
ncbi:uncharacterized protein LOC133178565 isoform X2 [Saccostrea echinata]|uniref:uncharacterized protein LOC133178565 isoform X2 n=1 Tax=Saccostrea echinata TaxID=191078 RepID=UPI002A7EB2BE|nr:uncharacterized protein LOC133178565 isoform X2 [Saccostrea echinata]